MKTCAVLDESGVVMNIVMVPDEEAETPTLVAYTDANPAYIGGDYVGGYFYPPQPFPSWMRSQGEWMPPTPYPTDGERYYWDEATLSWVEMSAN